MTGSFSVEAGKIIIAYGARTVSTTDGNLVNLLPTIEAYNVNITFPDFIKDYAYNWWWFVEYNFLFSVYGKKNGCHTKTTIIPQEWSQITVLGAAPTGADIFATKAVLARTTAPTHTWGGSTIEVRTVENQWLPFTGSVLLEAEIGMSRAMSIYISGGNLVLHQQQSISVEAGGFQSYGDPGGAQWVDRQGEEWVYSSNKGIPVFNIESKTSSTVTSSDYFRTTNYRLGGANACSIVDPTNYQSIYNVQIEGQFGRRS